MCVPSMCEDALDAGAVAGLRTNTLSHIRSMMLRVFKLAKREDLRPDNPVEETETPVGSETRKERVILTDEEFERFIASPVVDPELKMMAIAARILGGMRTSDVNRWDWAMFDRVHFERVIIPRQKTKRSRAPQELEVPPSLRPLLRARWKAHGKPETGPVFPVQVGPRAGEFRATRGISYAKRLRRELLRAGIIRHHCTRPADAPTRKVNEPCCERLASDPLYSETARTLPVDFHKLPPSVQDGVRSGGCKHGPRDAPLGGHGPTHPRGLHRPPPARDAEASRRRCPQVAYIRSVQS